MEVLSTEIQNNFGTYLKLASGEISNYYVLKETEIAGSEVLKELNIPLKQVFAIEKDYSK